MYEQKIRARDGHIIHVYIWQNEHAKAWIHINHGMSEHALRYHDFALALVAAGYSVVAHNHRGHGSEKEIQLGCFKPNESWQSLLNDIDDVRNAICDKPGYYLFGHSMGSFIVQSYLIQNQSLIDGVILSGSNLQARAMSLAGYWLARFEKIRVGNDNSSSVLQFLSFGSFNTHFKPIRTEFDWLSRDTRQVDQYIADPLCGFACSTNFWCEFLASLAQLFAGGSLNKLANQVPLLIMGGTDDPVGLMGKGLPKLANAYKQAGQTKVTLIMYDAARHEILNETNHQQVKHDIIGWLAEH